MRTLLAAMLMAVPPVGGSAPPTLGPVPTPSPATFTLAARADGALITVIDPKAPLVVGGELVEASPATAQAAYDSLGESSAFAGLPYPGAFVATLPGTVDGLLGSGAPPIPPYPFYVSSTYPATPSDTAANGPYAIGATSSATASDAHAQLGLSTGSAAVASITATASSAQQADGSLVATAADDVEGLSLGSVLRIGSVTSTVHGVVAPGRPLAVTSSVQFGTITVAGTTVGLTDKGLQVGSSTTPAPTVAAVTAALKAAGIDLSYVPAVVTPTSATSSGLRITFSQNVPTQGTVSASVTVGLVSVSLLHAAGGTTPGATAPTAEPAPALPFPTELPVATPSVAVPAPAPPPTASAPAAVPSEVAAGAVAITHKVTPLPSSTYVILVLAALAVVGSSRIARRLGGRST